MRTADEFINMKKRLRLTANILSLGLTIIVLLLFHPFVNASFASSTLWEYQCIDTMKTSRDKARTWKDRPDLLDHIKKEVEEVRVLGANCIAISTPYDSEFIPYMMLWVKAARENNLHIWFRGNFSGWEGWFDYPKGMDEQDLFQKTQNFITTNPDLFEDGDMFTAAPEGENGGPFNQVEVDEYNRFRKFLIQENQITKDAFDSIGKSVSVNWFSMNGGLARRMLDQKTVDGMDTLVTIDHYIKTPEEMGEFVDYFYKKFSSPVVIGEFGAPIPEINGNMSQMEQANFVESLFQQLYEKKDRVRGVNYWTLYDGSTAVLNEDLSEKPVAEVLKKYFKPYMIAFSVTNSLHEPISDATVQVNGTEEVLTTDMNGKTDITTPNSDIEITVKKEGYEIAREKYRLLQKESIRSITLTPTHPGILYRIRLFFHHILLKDI